MNETYKSLAKQFVKDRLKELALEAKKRGTTLTNEAREVGMKPATLNRWRTGKTEATLYGYKLLYDSVMGRELVK